MIHSDDWRAYRQWRHRFAEVIDTRFYSVEWLDAEVLAGRARVWASDLAGIIATLKDYPAGGREVHGLVAAGVLEAIMGLIPLAEAWGRENGAIVAGIASRPGWTRAVKGSGYHVYQVELRKAL